MRAGWLRAHLACSISAFLTISLSSTAAAPDITTGTTARVLVWVRDGKGAPVAGLTENDFVVTENGELDTVVGVERFFTDAPAPVQGTKRATEPAPDSPSADPGVKSWITRTYVLAIMAPMQAQGRHHAIADALRFLARPEAANWKIALVDDECGYLPYSPGPEQVRVALKRLQHHYGPHTACGWFGGAVRAINELGILPGRHVIVLISGRNAMISPSSFIEPAVQAQAPLYTVESDGPTVVVPFGGAADQFGPVFGPMPFITGGPPGESGNGLASMGYIPDGFGAFVRAAEETGGLNVDGMKDAFEHIAADAAGYYLVSFKARVAETDGTWHPFSVSVRRPQLTVKGPRCYMVPFDPGHGDMPEDMKAALESPQRLPGLEVVADSWLFPDQGGVHWGAFAADVHWHQGAPAPGSRVKIHAQLINDSLHGVAGSWFEEKDWPTGCREAVALHWQQEARLYPGSYQLRVTAMDTASGKIASGTTTFMARPLDVLAFRFSGIVLADGCMPAIEQAAIRRNLFDPMLWEGCKLAPAAGGTFRAGQDPVVLVRLYPPNQKFARLVMSQWKAYAVVDDADEKATELTISAAEVRGLQVSGRLGLNGLSLKPGKHRLTVLFVFPGKTSKVQTIPLTTEFSIQP